VDVKFRPHHFLCALCFQGRGYSPAFIANFQTIMDALNAPDGDLTRINVINETDSICNPCPNRIGKTCTSEANIAILDDAHAAALQIQAGDHLTWGEAKKLIAEKITLDKFHHICATCSWKKLGICESILKKYQLTEP
jgi:uncharacterized protein